MKKKIIRKIRRVKPEDLRGYPRRITNKPGHGACAPGLPKCMTDRFGRQKFKLPKLTEAELIQVAEWRSRRLAYPQIAWTKEYLEFCCSPTARKVISLARGEKSLDIPFEGLMYTLPRSCPACSSFKLFRFRIADMQMFAECMNCGTHFGISAKWTTTIAFAEALKAKKGKQ